MLTVQLIIFTLCALAHMTMQAYVMPPADLNLHIYALPVGQGDATVIQCPSTYGGRLTIVDMGSTSRAEYMSNTDILNFFGTSISKIDYVYLTHGDRDHYNILPLLNIQVSAVKGVYIGCDINDYQTATDKKVYNWLISVNAAGKLTRFPSQGCTSKCNSLVPICGGGNINMRVMGANLDQYDLYKSCANGDSLVVRLEYNHFRLMNPGDLEDYEHFTYDSNGYITSASEWGKPGNLRLFLNGWADPTADFYRLAHHGSWPNANKQFFLEAIDVHYTFSSSKLPGTGGKNDHPNCDLYDLMVNQPSIPIVKILDPTQQQLEYSCSKQLGRDLEDNNIWGIYTTAVCDKTNVFHNYIIKIDTDGNGNDYIRPVQLAPSSRKCWSKGYMYYMYMYYNTRY